MADELRTSPLDASPETRFCWECQSLAYGEKCFICGHATGSLDAPPPQHQESGQHSWIGQATLRQFVRVKQIVDWSTVGIVITLAVVFIGTLLLAPGLGAAAAIAVLIACGLAFGRVDLAFYVFVGLVMLGLFIGLGMLCIVELNAGAPPGVHGKQKIGAEVDTGQPGEFSMVDDRLFVVAP